MDEHPPPLRNDKKDADKGKDASPSFHKGNQKSELRKDSLLESDDNDDNDKMIGVIETLAEKHHQTTASSSDLEHSELTAAPQDDNDTTRNRPLPRLLMPATRVVKKPPSLTNLHPGAYLVRTFTVNQLGTKEKNIQNFDRESLSLTHEAFFRLTAFRPQ
jgi:hypothetical protein